MMALPMNSLYSLTWGDYGTSLVSAIQLLRCHGDLVDCTLAAGGRSFPAHKIVLCAASPFLLDLLKNTPCKHPVVMLAGVNANDLEALLEFVYRGEVSVDHAQLPSLLQAAQCLNIQGLAPQTVTKDDYTTHSIQLQHMIPQHHHEQDQLIATIATAPQQTVHAQVVDDIHQTGQILQTTTQTNAASGQQQTIVTTDATKDVIQQYLPARKRKPRVKKMSPTAPKVTKVEGMDTIISTPTSSHTQTAGTIQTTQQQQQQNIENGNEGQMITSTPIIKSEVTKVETIVMDPNAPGEVSMTTASTTTPAKTGKRAKSTPGGEKPRSRSQSEQPATCPICYAVIRQSRNLRRHLELRHFAKPGVKKEKKSKSGQEGDNTLNSTSNTMLASSTNTSGTGALLDTTANANNTVNSVGNDSVVGIVTAVSAPGKKTATAAPPGTSNVSGTSTITTTTYLMTVL
uniref:BTB domain-containing protein n=1 Tax=Glossina brevipalpis TaxID=37001 RepID=A0A1A9WD59_9MUSC